ncbi:MAG: 16S rRNA (adenine(1518)-N(6)/adenine(1519)-N(6))-dimethyltransferase RsmA [Candidatus Veblenbacteria bacterium]|nr:16S rRNA (adenine(1518)-N(6)/adenine(1519)-N(6))-dimethyltransferase RsmA [Candidatus Veblenbacteria bacterium]
MIRDSHLPPDLRAWTKRALLRYGVAPGKRLGQHFLVDNKVLADIVATAQLTPEAHVLEVGGGLGVLTLELTAHARRVVVVELDRRLAAGLKKIAVGSDVLVVVEGDIIKVPAAELAHALGLFEVGSFSVAANLPYEISGAFLQRFLWGDLVPTSLTLLLQREVAERIAAKPGQLSLLGLACQLKAEVRIVRHVPASAFWPPPRVESSLVRLDVKPPSELFQELGSQSFDLLWRLARIGFAAKRKLLLNNLSSVPPLSKAELADVFTHMHIPLTARAQELSPAQWVELTRTYAAAAPGHGTE